MTTNLFSFISFASQAACWRVQLYCIYFDPCKSFNVVDMSYCCQSFLCAACVLHEWLESYLYGRKCFIRVNGEYLCLYNAGSGVPQESMLGHLLLSIIINDVSSSLMFEYFSPYAHDIKIFSNTRSLAVFPHLPQVVNSFTVRHSHLRQTG